MTWLPVLLPFLLLATTNALHEFVVGAVKTPDSGRESLNCNQVCGDYEGATCDPTGFQRLGNDATRAVAEMVNGITCTTVNTISDPGDPLLMNKVCKGINSEGATVNSSCDAPPYHYAYRRLCFCQQEIPTKCPIGYTALKSGVCIIVKKYTKNTSSQSAKNLCYDKVRGQTLSFRGSEDYNRKVTEIRSIIGPDIEYFVSVFQVSKGSTTWQYGLHSVADNPDDFYPGDFNAPSGAYQRAYVNAEDKLKGVLGTKEKVNGVKTYICSSPDRFTLPARIPESYYIQMGPTGSVLDAPNHFQLESLEKVNRLACMLACHKSKECMGYDWDPASVPPCTLLRTNGDMDSGWKTVVYTPSTAPDAGHFGLLGSSENMVL